MIRFSSKYLKSYYFGKRTNSEKQKLVSDSVTQNLLKKLTWLKKQLGVYQCYQRGARGSNTIGDTRIIDAPIGDAPV